MVFRTRVDAWLIVILVIALGSGVWASLIAFLRSPREGWIALAVMIGAIALIAAISVPTEYALTGTALVIRSGVLRSTIPFDAIQRVYRTHNPLSAPAWSLDRIAIDYRSGRSRRLALISPNRQALFLQALQERVPLEPSGSALVRRAGAVA
jgi:hypothetical protein